MVATYDNLLWRHWWFGRDDHDKVSKSARYAVETIGTKLLERGVDVRSIWQHVNTAETKQRDRERYRIGEADTYEPPEENGLEVSVLASTSADESIDERMKDLRDIGRSGRYGDVYEAPRPDGLQDVLFTVEDVDDDVSSGASLGDVVKQLTGAHSSQEIYKGHMYSAHLQSFINGYVSGEHQITAYDVLDECRQSTIYFNNELDAKAAYLSITATVNRNDSNMTVFEARNAPDYTFSASLWYDAGDPDDLNNVIKEPCVTEKHNGDNILYTGTSEHHDELTVVIADHIDRDQHGPDTITIPTRTT